MSGRHGRGKKGHRKHQDPPPAKEQPAVDRHITQPKPQQTPQVPEQENQQTIMNTKFFLKPDPFDVALWGLALTFGIVAIYYFQLQSMRDAVVLSRQAMEVDQRAWMEFQEAPDQPHGGDKATIPVTAGKPVTYPFEAINIGKTAAKNLDMRIYVDIIDASQEVPLDRVEETPPRHPFNSITSGVMFPTRWMKQQVVRPLPAGGPMVATDEEVNAVRDGKAYLVVYGIIRYTDVFNIPHWTKFCKPEMTEKAVYTLTRSCSDYNSVDNN